MGEEHRHIPIHPWLCHHHHKEPKVDKIRKLVDEQDARHKRMLFIPKRKGYLIHSVTGMDPKDGVRSKSVRGISIRCFHFCLELFNS